MSQFNRVRPINNDKDESAFSNYGQRNESIQANPFVEAQQVTLSQPRSLSKSEEIIVKTINECIKSWYEPWKQTFLADGREFRFIYDLMEALLHYEDQIIRSDSALSNDRTNTIALAVARLVDYGNAILNMDLIIRVNDDEILTEIDPMSVTSIELFKAHLKADDMREKLLHRYFRKSKPNSLPGIADDTISAAVATLISNGAASSPVTLQMPLIATQTSLHPSPTLERSHRASIGSNTSINTVSDGRRTPQHVLHASQIEVKPNQTDLTCELEVTHMITTLRSETFLANQNSSIRLSLIPEIIAKIETLSSAPPSPEKLFNCFELLGTLLDSIERLPIESRSNEVSILSTALLKPILRKVYIDNREPNQHAHWTTFLLSVVRLMTAADFNNYLRHFNNLGDLGAFLKDYLFIVKRITLTTERQTTSPLFSDLESINNPPSTYPNYWIEMTLLACSTFLTSLTFLYQILRQFFPSNLQMWLSFIDCLVYFTLQSSLKPDRLMLKERQRLLADDLRQTAAEYIWISWDSLNLDQKQQLLEDLIEPLLRACMTYSRQRSILLPIFYDMMRCDYTSQYITPRGSMCGSSASTIIPTSASSTRDSSNDFMYEDDLESLPPIGNRLSSSPSKTNESLPYLGCRETGDDGTVLTKFTHLIVGKLNNLMMDLGLGDDCFKSELCAAISGELNPKYFNCNSFSSSTDLGQFKSMARHTSDLIAEFMQICLDARQANELSYRHLYLLCLFRLILFFRDKVDRIELYLSNLYKLASIHYSAGRFVETGYTLLEHAKTLIWSDKPLENHYRIITRFYTTIEPQQLSNHTSLKIFLYNEIIECFEQGQLWEVAVPLCRELVNIYEFKTYEYAKLALLLEKMSTYFNSIVEAGIRSNPEYFRVTFYGLGFPKSIRGSTMVYRGKAYEKLSDFQATMLSKYPDARLLTSLGKPDESMLNKTDARYLQINACSPVVDLKSRFNNGSSIDVDLSKIDDSILNYYRYNECDKFSFSRRISRPANRSPKPQSNHPDRNASDDFAEVWRERTTLTTNTLPGILPFFPVFLIETSTVSPIESAIEDLERTNDRLSCMVNRFKADKRQVEDVRLLGQLLLGVVDAAVNGGITKYEQAFFTSRPTISLANNNSTPDPASSGLEINLDSLCVSPSANSNDSTNNVVAPSNKQTGNKQLPFTDEDFDVVQVDRMKCLIAQQVPLLDEAIRLHRDRVADIMRPQHEHLEASYKKLKHHVMTKYSRYLPSDYSRSTIRSYRSLARSPNRSTRCESRFPLSMISSISGGSGRTILKRMSDAGAFKQSALNDHQHSPNGAQLNDDSPPLSSIPYKQLGSERRSLPFLTGMPIVDHMASKDVDARERSQSPELKSLSASIVSQLHLAHPEVVVEVAADSSKETTRSALETDMSSLSLATKISTPKESTPVKLAPVPATRTWIKSGGASISQFASDLYSECSLAAVPDQTSYVRFLSEDPPKKTNSTTSMEIELPDKDRQPATQVVTNGSQNQSKETSNIEDVKLVTF